MPQIDIRNTLQLQSPYLYCQAAGSTGADGTKQGIHLRWDLMRELGETHIPKGDWAAPGTGFNKDQDYVSIYKAPLFLEEFTQVDFNNLDPNQVEYLPAGQGIAYNVVSVSGTPGKIIIRFSDRGQFSQIMANGLDPANPVQDFLNKYTGIMEIEVEGKLLFNYDISFASGNGAGDMKMETVSVFDRINNQDAQVVKREYKDSRALLAEGIKTTAENIKYVRVQQTGMPAPHRVKFFTYEDMFARIQDFQSWEKVGDFSLSLDDTQVFTWFQGTQYAGGPLQLNWPKYRDGVAVNAENYRDRWLNGSDSLRSTIEQFIQLSNNDPRANINLPSEEGDPNGLTVSLLDMLKLVSLDYHAARMMGLGCLDTLQEQSFIYAAVYTTYPELPGIGANIDHVFMTLPTLMTDFRLPFAQQLLNPGYGLYVSTDENSAPELISDANGYSFYDNVRFVNLNKNNLHAPQPVLDSIPNDFFNATLYSQPVAWGIEYRRQGEREWRRRKILHDDEYMDAAGNPEVVTTPERETNPLYTHRETETGIHEYAVYAVNWFSRVSALSNIVATNNTAFPKRNTLLPPFNVGVQYIQEEDPLIFTTQSEQNTLTAANSANPNGDNYKTRVTFDWDNLHNNAYQTANKVEFFFRDTPVKKVEGKIKSVSPVSETTSLVATTSFVMASVNPAVTVMPVITPGEEPKFIGSLLNTPEGQFQILSITQPTISGDGPSFVVKKLVFTELAQATPDDPYVTIPVYTEPKADDVFFVNENVSATNQWVKLNRTVDLVNFSNTAEVITEDDGSTHNEIVGGINGNATITPITDAAGATGGYTIQFNTGINLNPHPDSTVSWIKGSARFIINNAPAKKKRLPVVAIQQTSPIRIVVYDPDYFALPAERIKTGSNVWVNFHPGYRVYLSAQAGVFDKTKIMPAGTANNKKTFIALRSADTTQSYTSPLTPPVVMVARNIQKPLAPVAIQSPAYATRPDFYGKSTYTLDIRLNTSNRVPYGIVVYRANEMAVLQTLYKPDTLKQVIAGLDAIAGNDPYRFNRWKSLVEAETDPADNNKFKLFGSYRFPNPDNADTELFTGATTSIRPFPLQAGETLLSRQAIIKQVIEDVFSPLTETPIVFAWCKNGYQTSGEPPKTRDIVGRLLSPADALFNPFPMAVKYPAANADTVRFTDYTLDGNAKNIYFYFAREIAVDTKLSARTPMSGPVVLVDAAPAEKPKIMKIVSGEAHYSILGDDLTPPEVAFELADYIPSENIRQYQVFRTTNFSEAATVRTMKLAATVNVGAPVKDNFADLASPPYGQPIYYRIVALKEIVNEKGEIEKVPSQPSELVLTNIIDALHPAAPGITHTIGSVQNSPAAYLNVTLQWPQTVHNGTYYLYKMTAAGNWELIWTKKTNAAQLSFPENGDFVTYPQTARLLKTDEFGNTMYHRFKVTVENASGLINQEEKILTI
jgi:hypothetical protein